MKLTSLSDRIFLYIENELSISTEVIGAYFIQEVSNYNTKFYMLKRSISILCLAPRDTDRIARAILYLSP